MKLARIELRAMDKLGKSLVRDKQPLDLNLIVDVPAAYAAILLASLKDSGKEKYPGAKAIGRRQYSTR